MGVLMEYTDAYILGASALADVLPETAPSNPDERLRFVGELVEQVKAELGSQSHYEHEEWLAICAGISNIGEQWVETGHFARGVGSDE
jgi:hypothetical protein